MTPVPAAAAPAATTLAYAQCERSTGGVTTAIRSCAADELRRQDARLNAAYRKLAALLTPAERPLLVTAQRAWLVFRDKDCAFQAGREAGGTLAAVIADGCVLEATAGRAATLERLLKAEQA